MDGRMTKGFQSAAMYVLVFIIALLLIAIVVVVLKTLGVFELEVLSVLSELSEETGLSKESEVLTFLGIGMTGVVLMLQALIANKRANADNRIMPHLCPNPLIQLTPSLELSA